MRERAEAATPGEWSVFDMDEAEHAKDEPLNPPGKGWYWVWANDRLPYYGAVLEPQRDHPNAPIGSAAINDSEGGPQEQADAAHIASWHPAIALAVADWLDFQAEVERRLGGPDYETPANHPALAVADAYLGSAS